MDWYIIYWSIEFRFEKEALFPQEFRMSDTTPQVQASPARPEPRTVASVSIESSETKAPRLRLWPAVLIVVIQWLVITVPAWVMPGTQLQISLMVNGASAAGWRSPSGGCSPAVCAGPTACWFSCFLPSAPLPPTRSTTRPSSFETTARSCAGYRWPQPSGSFGYSLPRNFAGEPADWESLPPSCWPGATAGFFASTASTAASNQR